MYARLLIRFASGALWISRALLCFLACLGVTRATVVGGIRPTVSTAVQYASRIWRSQDGLPENRVQALAQTPDGYLWVGTSGGLVRFDGLRFVVFARFNTPCMLDDDIHGLAVARDSSLWVATDGGGLLRYRDGLFRAFGSKEGLTNDFINTVLEDRRGIIWAGTQRGLFKFDGDRFQRVDVGLHLSNISFTSLWESADGVLAVGPAGLFSIAAGTMHRYGSPDSGTALGEVYRVRQTTNGALWLATNRGLKVITSSTKGANVSSVKGHTKILIDAITEDHAGNVWLGSHGDGLFLHSGDHDIAFRAPAILPDNSVSAVLEDRDQNIWVGTADGLVRLSKPDVQMVNSRDGLPDDNVATIYRDHRGKIWFTTVTGKVYRYSGGRVEPIYLPYPANTLEILGTFEDRSGAFWFGTMSEGVVRVANGRATRFTMAKELRNNGIQTLFEDHSGNLWVGTSSGLSRWNGRHFRNYYLEDGLSYGWVRAIAEDCNGDLLVGTDRGLNRFRNGAFIPDKLLAPLAHDRVWSIYRDSQDTLWIGTRGAGLVRIKNGVLSRITTREGLLSNSVFQVLGSGDRLWMSGPSGLSSASFAELNAAANGKRNSLTVLSYAVGGATQPTQMNGGFQPAACTGPDGELWFPSIKGAVRLDPKRRPTTRPSAVRFESFPC